MRDRYEVACQHGEVCGRLDIVSDSADSGLSEISDQGRRQWDVATQDEDRGDGNDDTAAVTNM